MDRKTFWVISVFLSVTMFWGIAFGGPNMKPGKWEITTETEMTGMPMKMPAFTHTQCLKAESFVPQAGAQATNKDCTVSDIKVSGNTVSWKLSCSGKSGRMKGTGKVTYKGDTMEGDMSMVMEDAGIEIKNKITGKRIGECD